MERNYDLCTGRDSWGRVWRTVLPAGLVRTGMFVRLVGGVFLRVEAVEHRGKITDGMQLYAAAQVLESVWEGKYHG